MTSRRTPPPFPASTPNEYIFIVIHPPSTISTVRRSQLRRGQVRRVLRRQGRGIAGLPLAGLELDFAGCIQAGVLPIHRADFQAFVVSFWLLVLQKKAIDIIIWYLPDRLFVWVAV